MFWSSGASTAGSIDGMQRVPACLPSWPPAEFEKHSSTRREGGRDSARGKEARYHMTMLKGTRDHLLAQGLFVPPRPFSQAPPQPTAVQTGKPTDIAFSLLA